MTEVWDGAASVSERHASTEFGMNVKFVIRANWACGKSSAAISARFADLPYLFDTGQLEFDPL
jgi:hypothetical protein